MLIYLVWMVSFEKVFDICVCNTAMIHLYMFFFSFFLWSVMEGSTALRSTLNFALQDIDDPDRVDSSKMGWFDLMNMDIEEANELKRKQKKEKAGLSILEQNLPKNMKVPNKNLPTFNAMFVSGIVFTLHVLVILLQVWLVRVKLFMNYQFVRNYDDEEKLAIMANKEGMVVLIQPSKGRLLLSPVSHCQSLGLSFEYSRRKFVLDIEDRAWNKISPPKTIPLKHFNQWKGHTEESATRATIMFGANCTDIKVKVSAFVEFCVTLAVRDLTDLVLVISRSLLGTAG